MYQRNIHKKDADSKRFDSINVGDCQKNNNEKIIMKK